VEIRPFDQDVFRQSGSGIVSGLGRGTRTTWRCSSSTGRSATAGSGSASSSSARS